MKQDDVRGSRPRGESHPHVLSTGERLSQLFKQTQEAAGRLQVLRERASEELLEESLVLEAFQELDSAHEELRVAEEHLHTQTDAVVLAREAVEAERRRYRQLFDSAPEAYLLTDPHGIITEANWRAGELLNSDACFLPGKSLQTFLPPNKREKIGQVCKALSRGEPVLRFELDVLPRQHFDPLCTTVSVCRAVDGQGAPSVLCWLMRRPRETQRVRLERESELSAELHQREIELANTKQLLDASLLRERAARQCASSATRGKHAYLSAVAQELKDPLKTIVGCLKIALENPAATETEDRALAHIASCVHTLSRVVDDLLEHPELLDTHLGSEPRDARVVKVNLPDLLQRAVDACIPLAEARNVRLATFLQSDVPQILADPDRLEQLLVALVCDVLMFSAQDNAVQLSLRADGQNTELTIAESGTTASLSLFAQVLAAFSEFQRELPSAEAAVRCGLQVMRPRDERRPSATVASSAAPKCTNFRLRLTFLPSDKH